MTNQTTHPLVEPATLQHITNATAHPRCTGSRHIDLTSQNGFPPFFLSPVLFIFPHPEKGEVFCFSAQDTSLTPLGNLLS
jgi:hypothetical protein